MEIEVSLYSGGPCYKADMLGLPGSPPIGIGASPIDAVIDLFSSLLRDYETWQPYIKFDNQFSWTEVGEGFYG